MNVMKYRELRREQQREKMCWVFRGRKKGVLVIYSCGIGFSFSFFFPNFILFPISTIFFDQKIYFSSFFWVIKKEEIWKNTFLAF